MAEDSRQSATFEKRLLRSVSREHMLLMAIAAVFTVNSSIEMAAGESL